MIALPARHLQAIQTGAAEVLHPLLVRKALPAATPIRLPVQKVILDLDLLQAVSTPTPIAILDRDLLRAPIQIQMAPGVNLGHLPLLTAPLLVV